MTDMVSIRLRPSSRVFEERNHWRFVLRQTYVVRTRPWRSNLCAKSPRRRPYARRCRFHGPNALGRPSVLRHPIQHWPGSLSVMHIAGVASTPNTKPSEQIRIWHLIPLTFLLPSTLRSPFCGPDTVLCESRMRWKARRNGRASGAPCACAGWQCRTKSRRGETGHAKF
jgi:hypothetical protein